MPRKHGGLCLIVPSVGSARPGRGARVALLCTALTLALGSLAPRAASACSTVGPPIALSGYPNDGDVEVPTDVVPFYDSSPFYSWGVSITQLMLTSSAGDSTSVVASEGHLNTEELTLGKTLQPDTEYTLVVNLSQSSNANVPKSLTLTFTTGAGPESAAPPAPEAFLQHYQLAQPPLSSCSPWAHGTCVALSPGFVVEQTYIDEFGQEPDPASLHGEPWFIDLAGIDQGTNYRCVKLRTRGRNAVYSSPRVLCGADAHLFSIRGSENIGCTAQGLTQDGALVSSAAGAANGAPTASPSAASESCASAPGR